MYTRNHTMKFFFWSVAVLAAVTLLAGTAAKEAWNSFGASSEQTRNSRTAPHWKDGIFLNTEPVKINSGKMKKRPFAMLRFLFSSPNAPVKPLPVITRKASSFSKVPALFEITWLGHSSVIMDLNHSRFAVDPVFGNASPVPFTVRRYSPSPMTAEELPPLDFVLLTHDHYDHLEYSTIRYLKDKVSLFIAPLGVGARLRSWGVSPEKIIELDWNETWHTGRVKVTLTETRHFSGRTLRDRFSTLWGAYVLEGGGKKVFFGGDSGYGKHYRETGAKYGPFDLVLLECDAWNENWPLHHLFPEQIPQSMKDLKGKKLLPIHWGVFDLAMHPWKESIEKTVALAEKNHIPLFTPVMGETISPDHSKTGYWWRNVKE